MLQYEIKRGDSLSLIARRLKLADWKPLWVYNTKFSPAKRLPGNDPDKIPVGATILIPRTAEQYDSAIATLTRLYIEVGQDLHRQLEELKGYKKSADETGKNVDDLAEIGIALVGVGGVVKSTGALATRYRVLRIGKELLKPAQKVAEHFLPEGEADDDEEKPGVTKIVVKKLPEIAAKSAMSAVREHSISMVTNLPVKPFAIGRGFVADAAKDAAKVAAEDRLEKAGMRSEDSKQLVDVVCGLLVHGAGVLDRVGNILEVVHPSWIAKKYVQITNHGESADDTYNAAVKHAKDSAGNSRKRLVESILRLQEERKALYGDSPAQTNNTMTASPLL